MLVGIPDPFGILMGSKVLVQVQKNGPACRPKIFKRAFIYQNPCLHPGNHRIVECVDEKNLHHLYNVGVLSATNCKLSLAAECSWGDLDGDHFSVIWNENLVSPNNFSSCKYSKLSKKDNKWRENVINVPLISTFFTDFMANDILGRIAHRQLALCDIKDQGALDHLAIELGKCHAQCINHSKIRIKPRIPNEAVEIVSTNVFPNFMGKNLKSRTIRRKF